MRMGIASNIVLDTLQNANGDYENSFGGPPFYAGLTCRRFRFEVALATKIGFDAQIEARDLLQREKIAIDDRHVSNSPSTRFSIIQEAETRKMAITSRCSALSAADISDMDVDCWLVSPVFDEVPADVLKVITHRRGKKDFVMLDPQGYMRITDGQGNVSLRESLDLDLSGINAIKVDQTEMKALTGGLVGLEGMRALQAKGIELILSTIPNEIHLLHRNIHYWAKIKQVDTPDSTGAGDILSAAFACSFLKEKDSLWALCFGAGTLRAALETKGIGLAKIPNYSQIEENASYFYNTIGFKRLS